MNINEWDSTTIFSIKINQQKDLEKYTYLSNAIYLYDENEEEIGLTNIIWYFNVGNVWNGYERFYLKSPSWDSCGEQTLISSMNELNLGSFDHILTINVNSPTLYSITVPEQNVKQELDMSVECENFDKWLLAAKNAKSAKVTMVVNTDTEYFETFSAEFKIEKA